MAVILSRPQRVNTLGVDMCWQKFCLDCLSFLDTEMTQVVGGGVLQWRHNERDGVSNHQRFDCLLDRLFGYRSKLRTTGLCERTLPVTGGFHSQRVSSAEISIWWRHHGGSLHLKDSISLLMVTWRREERGHQHPWHYLMTSSNRDNFRGTGPFLRGIYRSQVNSPHKGQWRRALMFSLIRALNKRFSKQAWGWWFEKPSRSLWRHCHGSRSPETFQAPYQ